MSKYAERIAREYPVRFKPKEKEAFRLYAMGALRELGYEPRLQDRETALRIGGRVTNVVAGDPETAKIVLVAHYDTALRSLFPPLIMPTRPVTALLYMALTPVCVLLGSFLLSFALTFALNGEMSYNEVEELQYRYAKIMGTVRNRMGTWDQILQRKGWRWIQLDKCIKRGELAIRIAKRAPGVTALAVSRTHVACVKDGELIDTWDSRGGLCYAILVPKSAVDDVIWAINLDCKKVTATLVKEWGKPQFVRSRKRRVRRSHWVWG